MRRSRPYLLSLLWLGAASWCAPWAAQAAAPQTDDATVQSRERESTPGEQSQVVDPSEMVVEEAIEVRLVRMPILAKDRRNRPITDLRADELVVKDRGRQMEIAFLEPFVEEPAAEDRPPPRVRLSVDLPGGGEKVISSQPAEPRSILFFVDIENDQRTGRERAALQLERFVLEELDPAYRVAILSFDGETRVEQSFTSDRREIQLGLRQAFDRTPRPNIDLRLRVRQLIDRVEDCIVEQGLFSNLPDEDCLRAVALEYTDENRPRSRDFLTALEGVVHFAAGLEGRKSVVALSHGVPMNHAPVVIEAIRAVFGQMESLNFLETELRTGEGTRGPMEELLKLAIANDVTLHFVDRSLQPASDYGASLGTVYQFGAQPMSVAFSTPQYDLGEIASNTGGTFIASTELSAGVREALAVEEGGYILGFYTDRYLPAEKLAKISVKAKRKGVQILHRRGVYAPVLRDKPELQIRSQFRLGRPLKPESGTDAQLKVPFELLIEPRDLGYELQTDVAAVTFTVHVLLRGSDGRRLAESYHLVDHGYPAELWRSGDVEPVIIGGWAELPAGDFNLSARIRNPRTRQEGRAEQPLSVRSRSVPDDPTGQPTDVRGRLDDPPWEHPTASASRPRGRPEA